MNQVVIFFENRILCEIMFIKTLLPVAMYDICGLVAIPFILIRRHANCYCDIINMILAIFIYKSNFFCYYTYMFHVAKGLRKDVIY